MRFVASRFGLLFRLAWIDNPRVSFRFWHDSVRASWWILEALWSWRKRGGLPVYDKRKTLSNLLVGCIYRFSLLTAFASSLIYYWVYRHSVGWHLEWDPSKLVHWLIAILLADFTYYIYHVCAHNWNLIWGTHLVHHQPTEFNLSVAARISPMESFFRLLPCLPLALSGMPVEMVLVSVDIIGIAMFGLHTEMIRTLGPLEWIFNTPSHHRVHHSRDTRRLGGTKNYGGILIIWDRLFGTFAKEEPAVRDYGISHDSPWLDPIHGITYFYDALGRTLLRRRFSGAFSLLFSGNLPDLPAARESSPRAEWPAWLGWTSAVLLCPLFVLSARAVVVASEELRRFGMGASGRRFAVSVLVLAGMLGLQLSIGKWIRGSSSRRPGAAFFLLAGVVVLAGVSLLGELEFAGFPELVIINCGILSLVLALLGK